MSHLLSPYKSYKFHKEIHDTFRRNGIQCDFKIVKQTNLTNPQFIINCALYQIKKKVVTEYVADFINTLRAYKTHKFRNYILRVYYDKSAAEYITPITKAAAGLNLELIEYLFRDFQRDGVHMHHFGALIRYMPLFSVQHNCAINCILDIDTYMSLDTLLNKISDMNVNGCSIYGYVLDSIYFDEKRYSCEGSARAVPPLLGGCLIIKREVYPTIDVLISFLKNARAGRTSWTTFKYGTDENFLNCRWLPAAGKCRIMYDVYYLYIAKLVYYIMAVPFNTYNATQKKYITDAVGVILRAAGQPAGTSDKELLDGIDKITYYHTATKKNNLYEYLRANSHALHSIYEMLGKILTSEHFKNVSIPIEYRAAIRDNLDRAAVLEWPPPIWTTAK